MIDFRITTDEQDIPHITMLSQEAHEESRFGYIPFSAEKVAKIARGAFADPKRHAIMLAFRGDAPVGLAYCSVSEYHIGTGVLLTSIHNINVRKSVRAGLSGGKVAVGLFSGVTSWSAARGAKEILFHVTSGVQMKAAHSLAKRMGFDVIGGSYVV